MVLSRERSRRLSGFIEPCLPRQATKPPAGSGWIHEIKHDGFRIMTRLTSPHQRVQFTSRLPEVSARGIYMRTVALAGLIVIACGVARAARHAYLKLEPWARSRAAKFSDRSRGD